MMRRFAVLLTLVNAWPMCASAATHVNACHHDQVIGPGLTNLSQALGRGGEIVIDCPGSLLLVTASYSTPREVSIDGRGVTLLIDSGALPTFALGGRMRMRNLTLKSTGTVPEGRTPSLTTFLVGRGATLELERVTAQGLTRPAFVMQGGRVVITDSHFAHGRDPIRVEGGHVAINGTSTFTQWPTALRVLSGSAAISGTTFRRSRLVMDKCSFTIEDSEFLDNDVRAAGLSGGAIDTDCSGRINRSLFVNNNAVNGGAINLRGLEPLQLFRVRFTSNSATGNGGAVHRSKYLTLRRQRPPPLAIAYSVFRDNSAENGGGVYVPSQTVEARAVHFARNTARRSGGGIYSRALTLTRGAFVGNQAGVSGGGIYSLIEQHPHPGLVNNVIANTLVVKNAAPAGAGILGSAMRVLNSTVADNQGTGISAGGARVRPAAITLVNTLMTNNSGGNCAPAVGADGVVATQGPNLEFPSASCPGATIADPALDPMYSPVVGSPALANADITICTAPPIQSRDVYGEPRPQGNGCTLGAVEGAVDRLVLGRLLHNRQEISAELLLKIKEAAKRLWGE